MFGLTAYSDRTFGQRIRKGGTFTLQTLSSGETKTQSYDDD